MWFFETIAEGFWGIVLIVIILSLLLIPTLGVLEMAVYFILFILSVELVSNQKKLMEYYDK